MNSDRPSHGFVLQIRGLSKSFPGVHALVGVQLDVAASEVHALMGGNGAGKSRSEATAPITAESHTPQNAPENIFVQHRPRESARRAKSGESGLHPYVLRRTVKGVTNLDVL